MVGDFLFLRLTGGWWFTSASLKEPQMTSWPRWVSDLFLTFDWTTKIEYKYFYLIFPFCLTLNSIFITFWQILYFYSSAKEVILSVRFSVLSSHLDEMFWFIYVWVPVGTVSNWLHFELYGSEVMLRKNSRNSHFPPSLV